MSPDISVIVPVYNRPEAVVRALRSIAVQAGDIEETMEIVVVDNASTDTTPEALRFWASSPQPGNLLVTLAEEPLRGAARARSRGTICAKSPVICFFDSDDIMPPGTIAAYLEAFRRAPDTQLVMAPSLYLAPGKEPVLFGHRKGSAIINHLHHCILRTFAYAVRKDFFQKCGGWDSDIGVWDDWELGFRLLLHDPKTTVIDHIVAHIHPSAESLTGPCYASHRFSDYDTAISAAEKAVRDSSHPQKHRLLLLLLYRRMMVSALFAREARTLPDEIFLGHTIPFATRKKLTATSREIAADTLRRIRETARHPHAVGTLLRLTRLWTASGLRGAATLATPLLR